MTKFVPQRIEKEVISMRISAELLAKVDEKALEYNLSRNELLNQCVAYAMANMDDSKTNK